jgi:hypothetical protein
MIKTDVPYIDLFVHSIFENNTLKYHIWIIEVYYN